jgi:phosphoribosylformylglycinamidine synthase subunit PurS
MQTKQQNNVSRQNSVPVLLNPIENPVQSNMNSLFSTNKTVTQQYHAKIYVTLRPSVLDPAGTAVCSGLSHLGYDNVEQIRIGKYIELTLRADTQQDAETQLDRMCDQLLANTVIENYRFELTPLPVATGAS